MDNTTQWTVEALRAEIIKLKLEAPYSPKIQKLQQALDSALQASK